MSPPPRARAAGLVMWPRRMLSALVRGYRFFLSPWLGSSCRYTPSCSAYALEALQGHGAVLGTGLTAWRILRCGPWCAGGHDPVPPALFRHRFGAVETARRRRFRPRATEGHAGAADTAAPPDRFS